jgi:hypothetical protein
MSAIGSSIADVADPVVVVFEKRPRWAPELEREFADEEVRVVACRSIDDVAERSAGVERGAIVLDLAAEAAGCLRFLVRHHNDPRLPVFVAGSDQSAEWEWPVRELGAAVFFSGRLRAFEMAGLCRRQWATLT